jgi:hypothetical protein
MNEKMKMVANKVGIIGLVIVVLLACVCVLYTAAGQIGAIGSISVSSSPPGADISLNGEPISAVTPYTIQHLDPANTYTIELSLEGYQDWSRSVQVTSGETSYVSATLTPIPPPPICTPYATKCIGNNLYRCSYDGSRWGFMQSCEYGCSGGACNPAPPRGYISVTSSPSGASIYLDGSYKGITPRTISDVSPGWHRIKLSLSGYRSRSKDVRAYAGSTSSVDEILELIPSPGYISVSSSPSGAYIDLDGDYTGSIAPKTLSSVSPGTHIIRLRHTDYYDWTTTVDVASRGTSPVFATLTPISSPTLGSISVSSSPSGAYIKSLDGISYGGALKTPCTVPNVKPGTHVIELALPGYQDWSTSVQVNPGETSSVSATLTPKTTPATGTISVSSSPSSANVYLDNSYKGITPLTIPDVSAGTHTIKVTLAGYQDWSTSVQVTSGETLPVPASLTQAPTPTPKTPTTVLSVIVALFISGVIAAKNQGRKYKK